MRSIYVAAATQEIQRAEEFVTQIRSITGLRMSHDWIPHIKRAISEQRQDSDYTAWERAGFATSDIIGVARSDVFVLLAPENGGRGCWVEYGYALALQQMRGRPRIAVAGPHARKSIFTELADRHFDTDAQAITWLATLGMR